MVGHCDFVEQKEVNGLRPDVLVRLSNKRNIVIDAKTPLLAYLEAYECSDGDKKNQLLQNHASHVRNHINLLSQKNYWEQFENSPDFVVMFIPGEAIFGAALATDPSLIEYGGRVVHRYTCINQFS
jgi:DNA recombination protein RmuC